MTADPTATALVTAEGWLDHSGTPGSPSPRSAAGGGPIGSMPEMFGYHVPAEQAITLVTEIVRSPIRLIDTSNGYSDGESERRIGEGIRRIGGLPPGYWVSTKVDG
jgi:D-threo-aldose 1-dehydrogenase